VPSLLLVRHAQASFGAADYDVLSALGQQQARALADELQSRKIRIGTVVSGALKRQRETAIAVASAAGCVVTIDPRWDEYPTDDILSHHSLSAARPSRSPGSDAPPVTTREFQRVLEAALSAWIAAGATSAAAETWPGFLARAVTALTDVAAATPSGSTALVATSGGVLAALCVALLDVPAATFMTFNRVVVNAGITKVIHGAQSATLISFNDHAHLERSVPSLVTYR
jgi:broad specificity phosphatase PhoE